MPKTLSRISRKIHWEKIPHVDFDTPDEKSITLKLHATSTPFPRVTIITVVTDPKLFLFSFYSWRSLTYPAELLNWIIFDEKKHIPEIEDKRVRVITDVTEKKYSDLIKRAMNYVWLGEEKLDRNGVYMSMDCGDVMFPDTLVVKHRTMMQYKKDCVVPDTLAYYNFEKNTSFVYKLFIKLPRSGLYWKKEWWKAQSHLNMVGLPYIGNCITVGVPAIEALPQLSSIRFFENFPPEVKQMIKMMRGIPTTIVPASANSATSTPALTESEKTESPEEKIEKKESAP